MPDYNLSYVYVFAFFVAGALVVTVMMQLSHLLAPFKPTREKLQASLDGMSKFDLGGLEVGYSPKDHTGLDFSDLSIISASGKFRR